VQTVVLDTEEDARMVYKETVLITSKITMAFLMDFVKSANLFSSYIIVEVEGKRLNAKSILSMGRLTTHFGPMTIVANGLDSEEALDHLKKMCSVVQKKSV
jgi:phosphotransferase system HPr-like phosphotransfer protein